jgi:hypothetical protein
MRTLLIMSLVVGLILAGLSLSRSLDGADPQDLDSASLAPVSGDQESIQVRCARAQLAIAKLDLLRYTEFDTQTPNMLPAGTIDRLRRHVEIDEEQLAQYLKGDPPDFQKIYLRAAESALKVAQTDEQRKRILHQRVNSIFSQRELERAELVMQLATLNLERMQNRNPEESALTQLQWQIEELRNQMLELAST